MKPLQNLDLATYLQKQHVNFPDQMQQVDNKKELLERLFNQYRNCTACPLGTQGRTQVVFGAGNPNAKLMFIGEGPGAQEDIEGKPFVGRAGKLLTKIIEAMGFARSEVYISNTVKCRPPQNRAPLPEESSTCKQLLLFNEIKIIKPQIICTLGASATKAVLGEKALISAIRGMFFDVHNIKIMPTFHPAYLLRNPAAKRLVWHDMQKIMHELGLFPQIAPQ